MKKIPILAIALSLVAASFFAGWHFGRQSGAKLGANLMASQSFTSTYSNLAETHAIIEELQSGKSDDAKHMLYTIEAGNIFALEALLKPESSNL